MSKKVSLFMLNKLSIDEVKELSTDQLLGILCFINNLPYDHELVKSDLYDIIVSELVDRSVDLTEIDFSDLSFKSRVVKDLSDSDFRKVFLDLKVEFYSSLDSGKFEKTKNFIKKKFFKRKQKEIFLK